ncbi:hypothetical protein EV191_101587 [Tamaricihabitans halophyticus]|uniref:Uncharacterized protein n=1 Tax=Tamaricihabitans halophyticus TaxID=1262583 RepID=A0A4R2R1S8_9PSEU|nr:hypothetical protein [Tamaricihabitans halophyticus]TCP56642.1 hypothetical protein EV191_101587 [Tamaricihabitans halophyticus]
MTGYDVRTSALREAALNLRAAGKDVDAARQKASQAEITPEPEPDSFWSVPTESTNAFGNTLGFATVGHAYATAQELVRTQIVELFEETVAMADEFSASAKDYDDSDQLP